MECYVIQSRSVIDNFKSTSPYTCLHGPAGTVFCALTQ